MLNEELFGLDEKDRKLLNAYKTIEAFKKYDAERKEYIKSLEKKIQDLQYMYDDLQSEYQEMIQEECDKRLSKLREKVKNLKKNLSQCSAKLGAIKHPEILEYVRNHDVESVIRERAELESLKKQLQTRKETINSLRTTYKDLFNLMYKEGKFTEAQFSIIKMTLWGLNTRIAHVLEDKSI